MKIIRSSLMKPGMVALFRESRFLWYGPLGEPWDDVDANRAMIAPADYDAFLARLRLMAERDRGIIDA